MHKKDTGYLSRPADLIWIEGAREAVKAINDTGHLAFVVTIQSGIARGSMKKAMYRNSMHGWQKNSRHQAHASTGSSTVLIIRTAS